ncbi:conjugative transposon protein TraK [Chitinophaga rhizophila]|uniref:Conjugative transposon protein TraK n=1 Tax=Chitinophaga rhizophila TaxID=2866212 RepID=A0ABS7G9H2_9BACT|nr:conjugative transposon protein TraK [Chitinophaga rhizophila]MBW8683444.1 conjugative transposon protein TraK [Chitinophaga rhizophila]
MFKSLKNLEASFRYVRQFAIIMNVAGLVLNGFVAYWAVNAVNNANNKVHILYAGKALEAIAADRLDNVPVELRDHINMFHRYFFTLHPDLKAIESNINRALALADQTARNQYNDLRESGFYAGIITGSVSQEVEMDSISLDLEKEPYYFKFYGKVKITRPTVIVNRSLITEGVVRNTIRSDNNSHGFLIEKWNVIENRDISSENR